MLVVVAVVVTTTVVVVAVAVIAFSLIEVAIEDFDVVSSSVGIGRVFYFLEGCS